MKSLTHRKIITGVLALAFATFAIPGDSISPSNNPDVNNDGVVDLLDIIIVGQSFGEPVSETIEDPEIVTLKEENANLRAEIDRLNKLLEPPALPNIDILDLQVKIMQKNDVYWQFSWNLTLTNGLGEAVEISIIDILFLDNEGFIVGHAYEFHQSLEIGESKTFRGDTIIATEMATEVLDYEVELDY